MTPSKTCKLHPMPCPTHFDPLGLISESDLAGIVFSETRSLTGFNISDARTNIAHVIINGDSKYGSKRPITAKPPTKIPKNETSTYNYCLSSAIIAQQEANNGIDPTKRAYHFNLRSSASTSPFYGYELATQSGPFNNSFPTQDLPSNGIYVNTYR